MGKLSGYLTHRVKSVTHTSNRVKSSLQQLKDKITRARQVLSTVKISAGSDPTAEGQRCHRSYRVKSMSSSTLSQLSLIAATSLEDEGVIARVGSAESGDFLCIEVVDRKIRLSWNNGGGTQSIEHPIPADPRDLFNEDETVWLKILAER